MFSTQAMGTRGGEYDVERAIRPAAPSEARVSMSDAAPNARRASCAN